MSYFSFGHRLPFFLSNPLFGNRKKFGLTVKYDDPCWKEWEKTYMKFYDENQKRSVGGYVNEAGYKIMRNVSLMGKHVLEIGPGNLDHIIYWKDFPSHYTLCDIQESMLVRAKERLMTKSVPYSTHLVSKNTQGLLPFNDGIFDMIVSFYTFEHLYPFLFHLKEMLRVLKKGGLMVGAIPCEGGLAWGVGRFLTTRRWFRKNTSIDPDKIICWEHPNFADDILNILDKKLLKKYLYFWPLHASLIDLNLITQFIYAKK